VRDACAQYCIPVLDAKDLDANRRAAGHKAAPEERRAAVGKEVVYVAKVEKKATRCGLMSWEATWHGKCGDMRDGD
jgi:hypothetical protein